jgi:hypothetical protein
MRKGYVLFVAASIMAGVLLSGCATCTLKSDLAFCKRESKIAQTVGLYISPETKSYIASKSNYGVAYNVPMGKIIGQNAEASLGCIFDKVVVVNGLPGPKGDKNNLNNYTITLEFGPATELHLGAFTFTNNSVSIDLLCAIYNQAGSKIWSKNIVSKASKGSMAGKVGVLFGPIGSVAATGGYIGALSRAGEEALRQDLEKLNDALAEQKGLFSQ